MNATFDRRRPTARACRRFACLLSLAAVGVRTQESSAPILRVGEHALGELVLAGDRTDSPFRVVAPRGESIVLSVESVDFDAAISVEEVGGSGVWESRRGGVYTDAELEIASVPAELTVRVRSEDPRGGIFRIAVRSGPLGPRMPREEWLQKTSEHCERGASRAFERGDVRTSLRLSSEAWQYARLVGNVESQRRVAGVHEQRARDGQSPGEILRARAHLGMTERQAGSFARAQELLDEASVGLQELVAAIASADERRPWLVLACAVQDERGDMARDAGDLVGAVERFKQLVSLSSTASDARFEALAQNKLAVVLDESGDDSNARAAADRALEIAQRESQPDLLARSWATHGRILARRGQMRAAEEELERALGLTPNPELRATILGTLAEVYVELARYETAICALNELETLLAEHDFAHLRLATRMLSGRIAIGLGDHARARVLLESVIDSARSQGRDRDEIRALLDLGMLALRRGDLETSETQLERALEISEAIGDRHLATRALLDLGELEDNREQFTSALEKLHRAREVAEEIGDARYIQKLQGALAFVLCRSGDWIGARALGRESALALESLEEWEAAAHSRETLARVALELREPAAVHEEIAAGARALAKHETRGLDGFARASVRSNSWTFGAIAQDVVPIELAAATSDEQRARIVRAGFEASSLWKGHVILEQVHADTATIPDARASLPEGQVWIDFSDGLEKLYAYVVTPEGLTFHDLGERKELERDVQAFVDALVAGRIGAEDYARRAVGLHERLLKRALTRSGARPRELVVFPTPALSILPFDALVTPESESSWDRRGFDSLRCVVNDTVVVQVPSTAVLAAVRAKQRSVRPPRVLVVGDPLYYPETQSSKADVSMALRVGEGLIDYARLKGTRDEAFAIADLLLERNPSTNDADRATLQSGRRKRDFSFATGELELYLGSSASIETFGPNLAQYTHLHVAVHGHVDSDDPRRSGLVLAFEPRAGGLWTLASVLSTPLTADLVVLSACDTASGPIVRGEGIQSVAHAFLAAGARSVLATLWRVDDVQGAEMMKEFYARTLESGDTPAEALRAAKLALRARGERGVPAGAERRGSPGLHPHTWAPYIFVGAP